MNIALILAGGKGERMQSDIPKQLIQICGKPVICHTIDAFECHPLIDAVYVVAEGETAKAVEAANYRKLQGCVKGGSTRKLSAQAGVRAIMEQHDEMDVVLIHDAARPLVSDRIITDNIEAAHRYGACTTALPLTDTLLKSTDGIEILSVEDRAVHYLAQTPQSFRLELIQDGYANSPDSATDDTSILLMRGILVHIVTGEKSNIKLTTADDLVLAEAYLGR